MLLQVFDAIYVKYRDFLEALDAILQSIGTGNPFRGVCPLEFLLSMDRITITPPPPSEKSGYIKQLITVICTSWRRFPTYQIQILEIVEFPQLHDSQKVET